MNALLLPLVAGLQATAALPALPQTATLPLPPSDWSALPPLRYRRRPDLPPALGEFARDEVAAGRCPAPHGRSALRVDLAVLVGPAGVTRVVPRAIGCPTVEQYASGLVSRLARDNVETDGDAGWHVTEIDFAWTG